MIGNGGPNGCRVWWPAGLDELPPAERAAAITRGWWFDGDAIVTIEGRRYEEVGFAVTPAGIGIAEAA